MPALGPAGLAIPNFDPSSVRQLTPTASPAAAEIARQRGFTGDAAALSATPAARAADAQQQLLDEEGDYLSAAKTPELPQQPQLRPVGSSPVGGLQRPQQSTQQAGARGHASPLDPGGLSELQAVFAKRRQQGGDADS